MTVDLNCISLYYAENNIIGKEKKKWLVSQIYFVG